MSRVSSFFHRWFGGYGPILADISRNVVTVIVKEWKENPDLSTDKERRDMAERIVAGFIAEKYPHYAWLTTRVVDVVFEFALNSLRARKGRNS